MNHRYFRRYLACISHALSLLQPQAWSDLSKSVQIDWCPAGWDVHHEMKTSVTGWAAQPKPVPLWKDVTPPEQSPSTMMMKPTKHPLGPYRRATCCSCHPPSQRFLSSTNEQKPVTRLSPGSLPVNQQVQRISTISSWSPNSISDAAHDIFRIFYTQHWVHSPQWFHIFQKWYEIRGELFLFDKFLPLSIFLTLFFLLLGCIAVFKSYNFSWGQSLGIVG